MVRVEKRTHTVSARAEIQFFPANSKAFERYRDKRCKASVYEPYTVGVWMRASTATRCPLALNPPGVLSRWAGIVVWRDTPSLASRASVGLWGSPLVRWNARNELFPAVQVLGGRSGPPKLESSSRVAEGEERTTEGQLLESWKPLSRSEIQAQQAMDACQARRRRACGLEY